MPPRSASRLIAALCIVALVACDTEEPALPDATDAEPATQPADEPTTEPDPEPTATEAVTLPPGAPARAPADATPAANYQQYCALCHGPDREGYANDNAPSLRTTTLFELGPLVPFSAAAYGRPGTPMGPYLDELGGPMSLEQIRDLAIWLSVQAGVQPKRPEGDVLTPVRGDAELGAGIYAEHCASCHGEEGQGGTEEQPGTALGNAAMLATTPDAFLRLAIAEGREGTPMEGFSDRLSAEEIDAVTAFLRTRAAGWDVTASVQPTPPSPDEYVLNPNAPAPKFNLKDGRYVMAKDLNRALQEGRRMVLLDTRVPYFWAMAHLPGSVPIPYYSDFDTVISSLPRDTWIVAYCECPRAAADSVVTALRAHDFSNTAVLWEGYAGWAALGYPLTSGDVPEGGTHAH